MSIQDFEETNWKEAAENKPVDINLKRVVTKLINLPPTIKVLRFVGFAGVATSLQIYNFLLHGYGEKVAEEIVSEIVSKNYIKVTKSDINGETPLIFYLHYKGYKRVRLSDREIAAELIWGPLDPKRKASLKKDLVISESLVEWYGDHELLWYIDASQMSRVTFHNKWAEWKRALNLDLSDELIGDYKLFVYNFADESVDLVECATAVRRSFDSILKKPSSVIWFAGNDGQRQTIDRIKQHPATKLDAWKLTTPEQRKIDDYFNSNLPVRTPVEEIKLTENDCRVLELVSSKNMMLSTRDIMLHASLTYNQAKYSMTKLIEKNYLKLSVGKLFYGRQLRKPERWVYPVRWDELDIACEGKFWGNSFLRHAILTFLHRLSTQKNWKYVDYDEHEPVLTLSANGEIVHFLSDYSDLEARYQVKDTLERFMDFEKKTKDKCKLVTMETYRFFILKGLMPENKIMNLEKYL